MILTSPRMLTLVLVPLCVNIVLYTLFFYYGANYANEIVHSAISHISKGTPEWLVSISHWGLKILSWLLLALLALLTFTFVSGLIAAPFNDSLSRAAMRIRISQIGAQPVEHGTRLKISETIGLELKRAIILLIGALAAFILGIIPFLQLPALAMGAFLVSFEYFGYPISHRSRSLMTVLLFTLRHPAVSLGFGAFLLLLMTLPFASIFYIPLAVVGGSALYADLTIKKPGADTRRRT